MNVNQKALAANVAMGAILLASAVGAMALAALVYATGEADSHEAMSGVEYPAGCCHSAALRADGDCAEIDDQYVTEEQDGYHVDLPSGAHPRLLTKGYSGVIPYTAARHPLDGKFHICLATDGRSRFCFFPKAGAV